jgi:hypothetical protein
MILFVVKHVREDRTFIYYFDRKQDGTYVGIRVGRSHAWRIEGIEGQIPERFAVCGQPEPIPAGNNLSEEFSAVAHMVGTVEPDLERILSGSMTFDGACNATEG